MADPVVLIGTDAEDGSLGVVGLYESTEAAQEAVRRGDLPCGYHYSVMTPQLDSYTAIRPKDPDYTDGDLIEASKSDNALLADMAKMELHRRGKGPAPWKITGISPVSFWKTRNSGGE